METQPNKVYIVCKHGYTEINFDHGISNYQQQQLFFLMSTFCFEWESREG